MMKTRTKQDGFTLIEVLIAMMIVAGAIAMSYSAWIGNYSRMRNTRINNTMAGLLERKMTEYEVMSKEKPVTEIPEEESGDFGPKFPGYRWQLKTQEFEMPDITDSLVSQEGGANEMLLTIVRSTSEYFKEAVKEMSVTVFYKTRRGNEISHSATTYLIDYEKEMPMAAGMGGAAGGAGATSGTPAGGGKN